MKRRTFLASATALAACATTTSKPSLRFADEIDALVLDAMERLETPALAVAVYSRDGAYAAGYGVEDVKSRRPVGAETAFYIASATKPLTALMFATLHQRGAIDLDAPLAALAPYADFPASTRPGDATLRHLLTHVSGIANDPISYRLAFTGQHDPDLLWRLLAHSAPNAEAPFGQFAYTNTGYNIATILSDRLLKSPWQDLLQREIFAPLGLGNTSARMSTASARGWSIARPHLVTTDGVAPIALEKRDATMQSAGGVIMSARDAARWLEAMIEDGMIGGRRILPAEPIVATRVQGASVDRDFAGYRRTGYGLGWYLGPYRDATMLHHFGGFAGFSAHVSYLPAQKIGVAAFVNEGLASPPLIHAIANYVYDRAAGLADARASFDARIEKAIADRDKNLPRMREAEDARAKRPSTLSRTPSAYAGLYRNDLWGEMEIRAEGPTLGVGFGALDSVATPGEKPDAVRVELVTGQGSIVQFDSEGAAPAGLTYEDAYFKRA